MKKARKVKANIEVRTGAQLHKIINFNPIGGAIRTITNRRTKLHFAFPTKKQPAVTFICLPTDQPPDSRLNTTADSPPAGHHPAESSHHAADQQPLW